MPNYYQPEIETMPYEQLRELQNEKLLKQVRHVWDNVPYYRAKMEAKGVTPDDIQSIDDLHKLPRFIRLSRAVWAILMQNIALAAGIKLAFFVLAFSGHATMWMAVFADVGTALLVIGNGLRALRQ